MYEFIYIFKVRGKAD